jgi:hypothetical protein
VYCPYSERDSFIFTCQMQMQVFFRSDFIWGRESVYGVRGEWWVGRWWWPYRLAGPPYHFPNGLKGKGGKGNDFGGYENSTVYLCVSLFTFLTCERV